MDENTRTNRTIATDIKEMDQNICNISKGKVWDTCNTCKKMNQNIFNITKSKVQDTSLKSDFQLTAPSHLSTFHNLCIS